MTGPGGCGPPGSRHGPDIGPLNDHPTYDAFLRAAARRRPEQSPNPPDQPPPPPGHSSDDCGVFRGDERGSDPFMSPCKGAAGAPVARRKVGSSGEGTSEGGTG
ncbi:hypothetical protein GCM10010321_61760 [Streptomyces chartreusis]|nr:hypothetical protein GCM10010321_61760 [Streptomyces chartreusis]